MQKTRKHDRQQSEKNKQEITYETNREQRLR